MHRSILVAFKWR